MKRTKLIAMVSTLCLSMVMLLVGIWAAVIVNFNLYGNLTFAPEGIYVEISGQVFRGNSLETLEPITNDPRYTLEPQTNFDDSTGEPSGNFPLPPWDIDNLVFAPMLKFIQIEVYVTNYSDCDISATPNVTIGDQEISSVTDFDIVNDRTETDCIEPNDTATYKITFELISSTAITENLNITFSFDEYVIKEANSTNFPTLSFTSNGDGTASVKANSSSKPTGELIIPKKVLIDDVPHTVTSIGNVAFRDCRELTSITIPDSVTSIGYTAFYGCSSLTSITIPNSVTSIGNNTFYNCSSLASITIPDSVKSIGESAFRYCTSLASITIPNSVTSIGYYAFNGCTSLASITIPNSVTSIGTDAFNGCSKLKTVTIESNYAYTAATRTTACGRLLYYATTVKVLTSCIGTSTNSYLNNTSNFTKTTEGLYTVYTMVV